MAKTHGMSRSREYHTWAGMRQRCHNPKNKGYRCYGARGIRVCAEWLGPGGFERFFAHMGPRPSGTSIDRIDGTKGYEPGNVRWATDDVQFANHPPGTWIRAVARGKQTRGAKRAWFVWPRRRTLYPAGEMSTICADVLRELEERFGPRVTTLNPADFIVEEFYACGDYSPGNYHTDDLDSAELLRLCRLGYERNPEDQKTSGPLRAA